MSPPSKSVNSTTERLASAEVMSKIYQAADRLEGVAHKTPVLRSRTLDRRVSEAGSHTSAEQAAPGATGDIESASDDHSAASQTQSSALGPDHPRAVQGPELSSGVRVFLKSEQFQRVGAFKFRGAYNALSALSPEQRKQGVITYSSGNHAQAMALASKLLNIRVTVVMPDNAPAAKLAATRDYGAEVVTFDPKVTTREAVAAALPQAAEAILIPPFDHYDVIAGQGTAALEFHQQVASLEGAPLDVLLVPVGGAGLLAGSAVATHALSRHTRVIGVEPANADDAAQSMRLGKIVRLDTIDTIADGTRTPAVGERNFALIQELVSDIVTVSEQAIAEAVRFLFERMNVVVEPSGALGVAALLEDPALRERLQVCSAGGGRERSSMEASLEEESPEEGLSEEGSSLDESLWERLQPRSDPATIAAEAAPTVVSRPLPTSAPGTLPASVPGSLPASAPGSLPASPSAQAGKERSTSQGPLRIGVILSGGNVDSELFGDIINGRFTDTSR